MSEVAVSAVALFLSEQIKKNKQKTKHLQENKNTFVLSIENSYFWLF